MKFLQNSLMWTASSGKSYSSKETRSTWFSSIFCQFCVYYWSRIHIKDCCWDANKQSYCEDNLEKICSAWHCELHQHKPSFTLSTDRNPFSHCKYYSNSISPFVALGTILQSSLIFWVQPLVIIAMHVLDIVGIILTYSWFTLVKN